MRIAVGSDEATELTTALLQELERRGHEILPFGPLRPGDPETDWPLVSARVAQAVAGGEADQGIVCCWTGTGASIWNHANVLALSLRATPIPIAREILDAWFATPTDSGEAASDWNRQQIERLRELEGRA